MKVGILVVAYNAETTLVDVLERIPAELRRDVAEVLVQDDHSTDDTFAVAASYLERCTDLPLTVLRHPANLGYGGNQKAGYEYAIRHGWDVVVLLHGDGQYAPEVMDHLIRPIVDGEADAVFGSRMMTRGEARRGGMPLYKYVGNRILTTAQNGLTGAQLSEWHSGYRAYQWPKFGMLASTVPPGASRSATSWSRRAGSRTCSKTSAAIATSKPSPISSGMPRSRSARTKRATRFRTPGCSTASIPTTS